MTESMSVKRHHVEEVHTTIDALYKAEKQDRGTLVSELKSKMDTLREILVGSPAQVADASAEIAAIKAKRQTRIDEARGPLGEAEARTSASAEKLGTFDDVLVLPRSQDRCSRDGCGGSCGECSPDEYCHDLWCRSVPQCAGKNCGEDGAGGLCGRCQEGQQCPGSQMCNQPTVTTSCSPECDRLPQGEVTKTKRDDEPGRYRARLYEGFLTTPEEVDSVIASAKARQDLNQRLIDEHAQRAATIAAKEQALDSSKETLKTSKATLKKLQKDLRAMKRDESVSANQLMAHTQEIESGKAEIKEVTARRKTLAKEISALKSTQRRQEPVVRECREAQPELSNMMSRFNAHVDAWRAAIAAHESAMQAEAKVRADFIVKLQEIKRSVAEPLAEAEAVLARLEVKAFTDAQLATIHGTSDIDALLNTPVIEGAEEMISAVTTILKSKRSALKEVTEALEQHQECSKEVTEAELACAESCAVLRTDADKEGCMACMLDELSSECEPESLEKLPSKETLDGYRETLQGQVDDLAVVAPIIPALTQSDARCRALRRAIVAERDRYGVE